VVPPPDRLSALDTAFLALDSPRTPLHVGWTLRFAGKAPPVAQLRRHLEARLHLVPRFRRRVEDPPHGVGDPRWIDDPAFDIAHHVHRVSLPDGRDGWATELREVAGVLLSTPLERSRPLWRMHLVDRVGSGFALVGHAHHALIDGVAAIEVATLLFGSAEDGDARGWVPEAPPGVAASARDAVGTRMRAGAGAGLAAFRSATGGPATVSGAAAAVQTLVRPAPPTALDVATGPAREVAFADVGLEDAKAAGRRHGATLNDVLLAATALSLPRVLRGADTPPPAAIKVLVPVSVRGDDDASALGNRISFLTIHLPLHEPDPVRVLRRVRDQTRRAKAGGAERPLDALARAADLLPAAAIRVVARGAFRAAGFNAVVSNVPGPPLPLELLGRRLVSMHPAVPIAPGRALSIGAVSYLDRLHVGVSADAAALGRGDTVVDLARDVERSFDQLRIAESPMPPPWRARALERRRAGRQPTPTG
jgi:WS/DGAT/MGAT family acyltransferase